MRRLVLLCGVVAALLLAAVTTASAGPVPRTHWTCDRETCIAVDSVATPRDADGCNHDVCIHVVGTAVHGYSTTGTGSGFFGHIHVWGPHLNVNGPTSGSPAASGSGWGAGKTCAEGWEEIGNGQETSVGLPCEEVS